MENLPDLTLAEQLSICPCADGLVLLSTNDFFMVACTGKFNILKQLPLAESKLREILVFSEDFDGTLHEVRPVDQEHWERFRDIFNAAVPGTFPSSQTFEDMLLETVKVFLNHREKYEAASFPLTFPYGAGMYGQRTDVSFKACVDHMNRRSNKGMKDVRYECWCMLMLQGLELYAQNGGALQDRRVLPLLYKTCAVCGGKDGKSCSRCHIVCYCCKAHQIEDWEAHKKECKSLNHAKKRKN